MQVLRRKLIVKGIFLRFVAKNRLFFVSVVSRLSLGRVSVVSRWKHGCYIRAVAATRYTASL